jgi:putative DNA-invertase from lambdoid prophage Rac
MSGPPQIFGYVRVSTVQQTEGTSLAEQERQVLARCLAGSDQGPWELTRLFVEGGVSASKALAHRPAGAELLAIVKPGDHVVAAKLDRMFRDAIDALTTIKRFREQGIHLWLLDFPGDCSGNGIATLLVGVLASVAQFERERIAERIAEGKQQQRREGKHQGGFRPFGFQLGPPGDRGTAPTLIPDEAEQAAIKLMKEMRATHTLREIAETLRARGHAISFEGVRRVLAREAGTTGGDAAQAGSRNFIIREIARSGNVHNSTISRLTA